MGRDECCHIGKLAVVREGDHVEFAVAFGPNDSVTDLDRDKEFAQ